MKNTNAKTWSERADRLLESGRFSEAIQACDEVIIALDPEFIHLAYYGKGLALRDKGEYEAALINLELSTENQPHFALAFIDKSNVLQKLNRLDEALAAIDKAIELQKYNDIYCQTSKISDNLSILAKAKSASSRVIELNPKLLALTYQERKNIYQKQGNFWLAMTDYVCVMNYNPDYVLVYSNTGSIQISLEKLTYSDYNWQKAQHFALAFIEKSNVLQKLNRLDEALAAINKAIELIELQVDNADLYYQKGKILNNLSRLAEAKIALGQAIELNPKSALAYQERGNLYRKQGNFRLAIVDYVRALEIDPDYALVYSNIGSIQMSLEKLKEARFTFLKAQQLFIAQDNPTGRKQVSDLLQRLSELDPSKLAQAKKYFDIGFNYHLREKYELAEVYYSKAIELNPNEQLYVSVRGLMYRDLGKDESAIADFSRVIEINPNWSVGYQRRASIYFKQKNYKLAEADWSKVISLDRGNIQAYYNRGIVRQRQGKLELASVDYHRVLRLNLKFDVIKSALDDIDKHRRVVCQRRGKLKLVKADFNNLFKPSSKYARSLHNRGLLYANQGDIELALIEYIRAIRFDPNYDKSYYNRGLLYHEQGETELALADYNQAIRINPKFAIAYYNRGLLYKKQSVL